MKGWRRYAAAYGSKSQVLFAVDNESDLYTDSFLRQMLEAASQVSEHRLDWLLDVLSTRVEQPSIRILRTYIDGRNSDRDSPTITQISVLKCLFRYFNVDTGLLSDQLYVGHVLTLLERGLL